MKKVLGLFLAAYFLAPRTALACPQELLETNHPKVVSLLNLAETQKRILIEQFDFYLGDFTRHQGFPLQLRKLRDAEIDKWENEYNEDLKALIFQGPQKKETIKADTFGMKVQVSTQFLEKAFTVYLLQYYLARAMAQYRVEIRKFEQGHTTLSRQYRERLFKRAISDVGFYSRRGLTDLQAFGVPVAIRRPSLQESFRIRTSVPHDVGAFLKEFERHLAEAGIHPGREYAYYLSLLHKLWLSP